MLPNETEHDFTGSTFRRAWQESVMRQAKGDLAYISASPEELIRKKRIGTLVDTVATCIRRMDGAQATVPWDEGWLDGKMRELARAVLPAEWCENLQDRAVMLVVANSLVCEVVERLEVEQKARDERNDAALLATRSSLNALKERIQARRDAVPDWRTAPPREPLLVTQELFGVPGSRPPQSVVPPLPEAQVPAFLRR